MHIVKAPNVRNYVRTNILLSQCIKAVGPLFLEDFIFHSAAEDRD